MKKICMLIFLAFISVSIYAVEDIERLMVEKADSPQEKKAIYNYLKKEAEEKRKMATRLREIANTKKGGKAATQIAHKKEMIEEANSLEALANDYEELAKKVKE